MRNLFMLLAAGALVLLGGTATAAPVNTTATISVSLGDAGGFTLTQAGTVDITGSGLIQGGGVTGSQLVIPAGLVTLPSTLIVPVPDSASTLVDNVILFPDIQNGPGTLSIGGATAQAGAGEICAGAPPNGSACVAGGGAGGIVPVLGNLSVSALGGAVMVPINLGDLNIGVGGTGDAGQATAEAAPWTTGVAQVNANGLATATGSAGAPVSFVAPTYVNALGAIELAAIATFSLSGIQVVPEPGTLLLLGTGIAGLALVGRSRRS